MSVCLWNSWNCLFDQWNSKNPVIEMTHLAFQIIQTQASWKKEFMRIFGEFGGDSIWSFYDRCLCLRTTLLGNPRPYKFSPWEIFWIPATNCSPRNARCSISIRNSETKQALKNIIKLDREYSTRIPKPNRPKSTTIIIVYVDSGYLIWPSGLMIESFGYLPLKEEKEK